MSRPGPSLKQRLVALASAPTSNTRAGPSAAGDTEGARPQHGRKRSFFTPPWIKRGSMSNDGPLSPASEERDRIQDVMGRMIYQAGVDYETRPMVVINASALPDPKEVSYDLLLERILSYLNLYVQSDYTVVFFAAGGRHTPGWNWIWKAYRSLNRAYRKNLKSMYIVHSSFFSKMLFSLAGAMISPKFFRKLCYINTLSELAIYVPLTQIDIPAPVYQENTKHEQDIRLPVPTRRDMFGVPLEELMGWDGEKGGVPRVIRDSVQFLRETGLEEEGLFRRSPSSQLLRHVQEAYDRGHVVNLQTFNDPNLAAVLIKKYLRDLPEPIFPESTYPVIRRCPLPSNQPGDVASVTYIRESLLPTLPHCAYLLLSYVLHLMHEVSLRASTNRMDATNLTIVLGPNLVKSSSPLRDVQMAAISTSEATLGTILKVCIQRYYECFEDMPDRTDAVAPAEEVSDEASIGSLASSATLDELVDDEDIDDAMLVMPLGPSASTESASSSTPSAWSGTSSQAPYKVRAKKSAPSSRSGTIARSMHAPTEHSAGNTTVGKSRTRSLVSVERGDASVPGTVGRSSIRIGRGGNGTVRGKTAGAGVSAVGVMASGFFAPPSDAPPLPSSPQ